MIFGPLGGGGWAKCSFSSKIWDFSHGPGNFLIRNLDLVNFLKTVPEFPMPPTLGSCISELRRS